MAAIGRLCYELLLMLFVVQVCQTAPASNVHRRRRRFIATLRDGFCPEPPASSKVGANCAQEALETQCHFDSDCDGMKKCCQHVDCIDVYVCTQPLTAYDLGYPYFRPGRCYNIDELMERLKGTCTEEASCDYDLDCSSNEDKCCFVDNKSCGYKKQCFKSIPNCNVRGMTYGIGEVYYRDEGCLTCTCTTLNGRDTKMQCVEEFCVNGVPIDTNVDISGPNEHFNRIAYQEGAVVIAGVASMNIGLQGKNKI